MLQASVRTRTDDQPGVATLKLNTGIDVRLNGGTTHPTSSSTFGECHASVTFLTGRPGSNAGARRREPIYEVSPGKADAGSDNVGNGVRGSDPAGGTSPPKHSEVMDGCRMRNSAKRIGFGERSVVDENVVRRGNVHPLSAGRYGPSIAR